VADIPGACAVVCGAGGVPTVGVYPLPVVGFLVGKPGVLPVGETPENPLF
jgi:hypothetical protein